MTENLRENDTRGLWARSARGLSAFLRARNGAVAMVVAFSLPLVIGGVALGVDVGVWYHMKRDLQTAADAAAIASTWEVARGSSQVNAAATRAVINNGYTADDIAAIEAPPLSGEFASEDAAYVRLASPARLLFVAALTSDPFDIVAEATATTDVGDDQFCVLALDETASNALNISGNVSVDLDCAMASNSSAANAINLAGNAVVSADGLSSSGGIDTGGSVTLTTVSPSVEGMLPHTDPYESLPEPDTSAACTFTTNQQVQNGVNRVFTPGTYCGGITITGGTAHFSAGTYIMKGNDLSINGGTVTSDPAGVFFFFTENASGPTRWANISITGNPSVNLDAPTNGTFEDILFYQDRDAPPASGASGQNNLTGGSGMILDGVMYFPSRRIAYSGGSTAAGCTIVIGATVSLGGNTNINVDCSARPNVDFPTSRIVRLAA